MKKALLLLATLWPIAGMAQLEELENPGSVSAVQDRQYRMSHELTLGLGVLPLDAFYKGLTAQVGYTYHFTDHFAWQVGRFAYSYNVFTGLSRQLVDQWGVAPTSFDQVNWMVGSDLVWSPFYGKFAYLNRSVTHGELFLLGGISVLRVTNGTASSGGSSVGTATATSLTTNFKPAVNLGLGLRLFSNRLVSFRLDFTDNVVISDHIYNVPTIQLSAALNFGASE